jgi:hypothetical protein
VDAKEYRAELVKIMPGYSWTVHRASPGAVVMTATGIQSSGFNRLSTLEVRRIERDGRVRYKARSAGYGRHAPWLHESDELTLARALRELQTHYEHKEQTYRAHAQYLRDGRKAPNSSDA